MVRRKRVSPDDESDTTAPRTPIAKAQVESRAEIKYFATRDKGLRVVQGLVGVWNRTMYVQLGIFLVIVGCCLNNVSLEFIIKEDRNAASVVTFCQFLFISLEGFIVHLEWNTTNEEEEREQREQQREKERRRERYLKKKKKNGKHIKQSSANPSFLTKGATTLLSLLDITLNALAELSPVRLQRRRIPLWNYLIMVTVFFFISVINNAALGYNIAMPFHMIFRSGSLISTAVLGRLVFKHVYSVGQYIAAFIVTLGIITATLATINTDSSASLPGGESFEIMTWAIGITMLLVALLLSSVLGLYQEHVYNLYKGDAKEKPYRETMFYSHFIALPLFITLLPDMIKRVELWSTFTPIHIPFVNVTFPVIWLHLLCNVVTQYICIRGVFMLTGNLSSLSTTLVISIRKFISLIISVFYFSNPFTAYHWFGTVCVFGGTFLYTMTQPPRTTTTTTTTTSTTLSNGNSEETEESKRLSKLKKHLVHQRSKKKGEQHQEHAYADAANVYIAKEKKKLKGVLKNSPNGSPKPDLKKKRKSVSFSE